MQIDDYWQDKDLYEVIFKAKRDGGDKQFTKYFIFPDVDKVEKIKKCIEKKLPGKIEVISINHLFMAFEERKISNRWLHIQSIDGFLSDMNLSITKEMKVHTSNEWNKENFSSV